MNTEEEEANKSRRNLRARTGVIHEPHYRPSGRRFHSYQRRGLELYMSHITGHLAAGSTPTRGTIVVFFATAPG
jgi:hypothetical protein